MPPGDTAEGGLSSAEAATMAGMSMATLEVVAILLAAVLGWTSGALKAHLHSLRPPHAARWALFSWRRGVQA